MIFNIAKSKTLILTVLALTLVACSKPDKSEFTFWNGNKSEARQGYELELLKATLAATEKDYGQWNLTIDNSNYTTEEESNSLNTDIDVLVTVAGNLKFKGQQKIVIEQALTKGLLGYRLLMVNNKSLPQFQSIQTDEQLQELNIGIPNSWADAELFRQNGYGVAEKGSFDDLFTRLKNDEFNYTALGANEIEAAFKQRVEPLGEISIEPTLLVYYPFPLLFYVNSNNQKLAQRITVGLGRIQSTGLFDEIFEKYHGDVVSRLNLKQRKLFKLHNPILPESMAGFESDLL